MRTKSLFLILILGISLFSIPLTGYAEAPDPIGYKIYGDVVEIWNPDTTYYFDKNSGIQWTEDPEAYWTRNVFAIGYFSGGQWNKIYSADELSSFNRQIVSDFTTYVNATLWKDFVCQGYNLRLGIKYHLKVEDTELSVTIYAKNLDHEAFPVPLGCAWRVTDIKIGGTMDDKIGVNGTVYDLDSNLDYTFENMTNTYSYFNYILNETVIVTEPLSYYRIFNDKEGYITLTWDASIPYSLKLFSSGTQDGSYVELRINAGMFSPGQEKSTIIYWKDPSIETLRPNANGDVIEMIPSPAVSNYLNVDEEVADDDTTDNYIYHEAESSAAALDLYEMDDTEGSGTINSINLVYRTQGGAGGAGNGPLTIIPHLKISGTEYEGATTYGVWVFNTDNYTWTQNPHTSSAWTWSDLDSLQAGVYMGQAGDGSATCKFTQIYIEVNYTPLSSGPTVNSIENPEKVNNISGFFSVNEVF